TALAEVVEIILFVIGQRAEVREGLQLPRLVPTGPVQQQASELQVELGDRFLVALLLGQRQGLLHQLQGAGAVALEGVDPASLAAFRAAVELAGDDVAVVVTLPNIIVSVAEGRRLQEPPVLGVGGDDRLPEVIDLIEVVELTLAIESKVEVLANLYRVGLGIESELTQDLVSVLVVAVLVGFEGTITGLLLCLVGCPEPGAGNGDEKDHDAKRSRFSLASHDSPLLSCNLAGSRR